MFSLIFSLTFSFPAPARAAHKDKSTLWAFPWMLTNLTNEARTFRRLNTLTVNPLLNYAAQMKAEDMAKNGYFAHTSPAGQTPWSWFTKAGYRYEYAGENLAMDFNDASKVEKAWLKSPGHRANIVDKHYTEIGTGIATGFYKGKKVTFIAQVYANPAPVSKL